MIYLGQDVADVDYGKIRLRLFHGSKGQSYARSLGLNNEKGAWIADLTTDRQGGIMTIEPEFIDFSGQKRLVRRNK